MDIPNHNDLSRVEEWLRYIATGENPPEGAPLSRVEEWLAYIAEHKSGGLPDPSELADNTVLMTIAGEWVASMLPTEEWTFTLDDDTEVTKKVVILP